MTNDRMPIRKLVWVVLFAVAFAFVEASVVVYLRAIYYPEGFAFPLKMIVSSHLVVEICREAATLVMLASVGILAGRNGWQRFGYFCLAFGVWDIFYYVWLKAILDWPAAVTEWDILFLIPLPWIGPVISALLIAFLLAILGSDIVVKTSMGKYFRPTFGSWVLAIVGTSAVLYSFMCDTEATLRAGNPLPYRYELLSLALILYITAHLLACKPKSGKKAG